MILGRAAGTVVATRKDPKFAGSKLLLVQPLDLEGNGDGEPLLAVDSVGAGAGELVLVVIEGRSASQAMGLEKAPANAAIVGIVDRFDIDDDAFPTTPDTPAAGQSEPPSEKGNDR